MFGADLVVRVLSSPYFYTMLIFNESTHVTTTTTGLVIPQCHLLPLPSVLIISDESDHNIQLRILRSSLAPSYKHKYQLSTVADEQVITCIFARRN